MLLLFNYSMMKRGRMRRMSGMGEGGGGALHAGVSQNPYDLENSMTLGLTSASPFRNGLANGLLVVRCPPPLPRSPKTVAHTFRPFIPIFIGNCLY